MNADPNPETATTAEDARGDIVMTEAALCEP